MIKIMIQYKNNDSEYNTPAVRKKFLQTIYLVFKCVFVTPLRRSTLKFTIQRCIVREARGKIQSVVMAMREAAKINMECMEV